MALTKCKECNKEISSDLKKCIHCGKDQRSFFRKHPILTFIFSLWLLGVFIGMLPGTERNNSNNNSDILLKNEEPKIEEFSTKDVVSTEKFDISVEKAGLTKKISGEYLSATPSSGGIYFAVRWNYKNKTNKPIGMLDFPRISLISPDGVKYSSDINATSTLATITKVNRKIFSDLNPGLKVDDVSVFEISINESKKPGWKLLVNADTEFYFYF